MDISILQLKLEQLKTASDSLETESKKIIGLAEKLQELASFCETPGERKRKKLFSPILKQKPAKNFVFEMTDRLARVKNPELRSKIMVRLIKKYQPHNIFSGKNKFLLNAFPVLNRYFPQYCGRQILSTLEKESESVIKILHPGSLARYISGSKAKGFQVNVNLLGEAILGEREAKRRLKSYIHLLQTEQLDYISVKLSSLYSQFTSLSWENAVSEVLPRVEALFSACLNGSGKQTKFINFDMEFFGELYFVTEVFKAALSQEQFKHISAGIALQCYLPNSLETYFSLLEFARSRVRKGGAPIKIRLVKGANLNVENAESALKNWESAIYTSKTQVDANYKRVLDTALTAENLKYVKIGIASHNVFDIAYGLSHWVKSAYSENISFEMLEGMAPSLSRVMAKLCSNVILYTPIVNPEDFHCAIAYLVRRLDENTTEGNFLREIFDLSPGSPSWEKQKSNFLESIHLKNSAALANEIPKNRKSEIFDPSRSFSNCPDTDWRRAEPQRELSRAFSHIEKTVPDVIPLCIGAGESVKGETERRISPIKSRNFQYRYVVASSKDVDSAFSTAVEAGKRWFQMGWQGRKELLCRCAWALEKNRFRLISLMCLETGKTVPEADSEISEAVDFANYYARSFEKLTGDDVNSQLSPLGTIVVAPPWNFPLAIPAGGVFSSLMAGNAVLLKPAPEAVLTGWELCKTLYSAGIPKDVLQFIPCRDDDIGKKMICHDSVGAVILTGSLETAKMFYSWKPHLNLYGETSGKNAIIVTEQADFDSAIQGIVHSAFSHNGQKCSAASLLVLTKEVYENQFFLDQLTDAAASLHCGDPLEFQNKITPLTQAPGPKLMRALQSLEPGEHWLLEPKNIAGNIWSPGIKIGTKPHSWFYENECFGPVLGIMLAEDLNKAIKIANSTSYGLSSGLYSLDPMEIKEWTDKIEAGNLYINRPITGAIVQRQPFGGWKKSAVGTGTKAGGPNYAWQFVNIHQPVDPKYPTAVFTEQKMVWNPFLNQHLNQAEIETFFTTLGDYQYWWKKMFSKTVDFSSLPYESNQFRYRPLAKIILRLQKKVSPLEILKIVAASQITASPLEISAPLNDYQFQHLAELKQLRFICEDIPHLIHRLSFEPAGTRYFSLEEPKPKLLRQLRQTNISPVIGPLTDNGWITLKKFLREQSISHLKHRYGNLLE